MNGSLFKMMTFWTEVNKEVLKLAENSNVHIAHSSCTVSQSKWTTEIFK